MATVSADLTNRTKLVSSLPGHRYDNWFFATMTALILATVFIGFAPTYYLAGVFRAPLPSTIIHVHGAIFSCWVLLFITQVSLVSAGRVDIHRRLGVAGFVLACLMVVAGTWAATDALRRNAPPGRDPKTFYIVPLTSMVIFGVLIALAYRARLKPAAHKRIILIATIALLPAPLVRWHFALIYRKVPVAQFVTYGFLLVLIAYDLWSMRKIHRATLWASGFLVFMQQISAPIGRTAAWHAFAGWVQSAAR